MADGDGCAFGASPVCDDGIRARSTAATRALAAARSHRRHCCAMGSSATAQRSAARRPAVVGAPPTCTDAIGCTNGRCDAATDACVQDPDKALRGRSSGVERCDVTGRGCACRRSDELQRRAAHDDSCTGPAPACTALGRNSDGYQAVDCNDLVVHPGAIEIRDGLDNSGAADDGSGMQCAPTAARVHDDAAAPGPSPCSAACTGVCVASTESRNDRDDNGNGSVDEGLPVAAERASPAHDCGTVGSRTCAADCPLQHVRRDGPATTATTTVTAGRRRPRVSPARAEPSLRTPARASARRLLGLRHLPRRDRDLQWLRRRR